MSIARTNFLKRIAVFKRTLDSAFLKDNGIAPSPHNEKARMLRNGISIIGFTILEDFIKDRTGEILNDISNSTLQFNLLSPKLQHATTMGALRSIVERAKILKRTNQNWITFIQDETRNIASTAGSPFTLSKYSIGWDKSNLGKDDIGDLLSFFNVQGGWNTVQQLTTNANSTLLSPDTFFLNAAQRRHTAAHNPNANSLFIDLEDFARDVRSFSFAIDVLISKGLAHILANNPNYVTVSLLNLRFLIKDSGVWKEYNSTTIRALRSDTNYNRILSKVRIRAKQRNEVLIVKTNAVEIKEWFIP